MQHFSTCRLCSRVGFTLFGKYNIVAHIRIAVIFKTTICLEYICGCYDQLRSEAVGIIRHLHEQGIERVAMPTGDNPRVAQTIAHQLGIAMGAAGTDVALETADLVLMGDKLELISYALTLSKKARRVVWQNIGFALIVIALLITGAFAINLPLPLGVLGHEAVRTR